MGDIMQSKIDKLTRQAALKKWSSIQNPKKKNFIFLCSISALKGMEPQVSERLKMKPLELLFFVFKGNNIIKNQSEMSRKVAPQLVVNTVQKNDHQNSSINSINGLSSMKATWPKTKTKWADVASATKAVQVLSSLPVIAMENFIIRSV